MKKRLVVALLGLSAIARGEHKVEYTVSSCWLWPAIGTEITFKEEIPFATDYALSVQLDAIPGMGGYSAGADGIKVVPDLSNFMALITMPAVVEITIANYFASKGVLLVTPDKAKRNTCKPPPEPKPDAWQQ